MTNEKPGCVLAEERGFGCVYDCGTCGNIHLTIGAVSILLVPDDYMRLVAMIHSSASNFEAWLDQKRWSAGHLSEHKRAEPDINASNP